MSQVNTIGMILYLLLAVFGGFLTGLFSRYVYQAASKDFGRIVAQLCSVVFYIAPLWALVSLFRDDDLDIFYLLLIASFAYGVYYFNRFGQNDDGPDRHYAPPDED